MNGGDAIRLDGVSTVYEGERIPAIRDISLRVGRGDFVCVVGPNGAGKTTLLETINGILRYTSGNVRVLGQDIAKKGSQIRKRIGYVIQNFEIDPLAPFLVKDIVMSGRSGRMGLLKFPDEEDWTTVSRALEVVGISGFLNRPIGKLSGGEFQKVLFARAIAQEPDIFLLDEPFANLDAKSRKAIDRIISDLSSSGASILMVSHELGAIPQSCTHIVILDSGRVIAYGTREEILRSGQLDRLLPHGHTHRGRIG